MPDASNRARLLPRRLAVCLALSVLIQAAVACWVLAPARWLPFSGAVSLSDLPSVVALTALAGAVLLAPAMVEEQPSADGSSFLFQVLFAALWQGMAAAFMLLVAARVAPLGAEGILQASLWIAVSAWLSLLLARVAARSYAALVFAWLVALPVLGYFLAEIFLSTPAGSAGWQQASGAQASAVRSLLHAILGISPGTALLGALNGSLPDGSAATPTPLLLTAGVALGFSMFFYTMHKKLRPAAASPG